MEMLPLSPRLFKQCTNSQLPCPACVCSRWITSAIERQMSALGFRRPGMRPARGAAYLFSLFDRVRLICSQIGPDFDFPVRPKDLNSIDAISAAETEVKAEIILGKITSATQHLTRLHYIPGGNFHPRIEREPVALGSLQCKADPVICGPTLRLENRGLTL